MIVLVCTFEQHPEIDLVRVPTGFHKRYKVFANLVIVFSSVLYSTCSQTVSLVFGR